MMHTPLQRSQIHYLHYYSLLKKTGETENFGVNSWANMSNIEAAVEEVMVQ